MLWVECTVGLQRNCGTATLFGGQSEAKSSRVELPTLFSCSSKGTNEIISKSRVKVHLIYHRDF